MKARERSGTGWPARANPSDFVPPRGAGHRPGCGAPRGTSASRNDMAGGIASLETIMGAAPRQSRATFRRRSAQVGRGAGTNGDPATVARTPGATTPIETTNFSASSTVMSRSITWATGTIST